MWALTSPGMVRTVVELLDRVGLEPKAMMRVYHHEGDVRWFGWDTLSAGVADLTEWIQVLNRTVIAIVSDEDTDLPDIARFEGRPGASLSESEGDEVEQDLGSALASFFGTAPTG